MSRVVVTQVPWYEPRPEPIEAVMECDHCSVEIVVVLEAWKNRDESPDCWVQDTIDTVDLRSRLCVTCKERSLRADEQAREYRSDVPPAWFDPAYAGECWHEDDY